MKLTFRDLKKQTFQVEVDDGATVGDVKKKVEETKGSDFANPRLIHSGKILQDDKTIASYNIKEQDHIICMTQKPKAQPASSQPPSTPAQTTTQQTPAAPQPAASSTTSNVPGTPSPAPSSAATQPVAQPATQTRQRSFGDGAPVIGPELQSAITNMESMGFERSQIERALRASFNNVDRAVEYLLNGIPEGVGLGQAPAGGATAARSAPAAAGTETTRAPAPEPAESGEGGEAINLFEAAQQAQQGGGRGAGRSGGAGGGATGGAGGGAANLDFLRDNPMFQQLRLLVQQQPQMLETVLQQFTSTNPQLAQIIQQNPEQFIQLLAEGAGGDEEGAAPLPPGVQQVSVTEEEREAIDRLCRLGFEPDLVIQAYFACDKNEELAANFLFDSPDDPDDQPESGN